MKFIQHRKDLKAMDCCKMFIEEGIAPMIMAATLEKSRIYKAVDKYLIENGYTKTLVETKTENSIRTPAHYIYTKKHRLQPILQKGK
jgi:transcription elongation factor GreA-like protein